MGSVTVKGKVKRVRHINEGVISTLKQSGVQSMLADQAADYASTCTSMMLPKWRKYSAGYKSRVVDRRHYAAGLVYTTDFETMLDNAKNNTLKKGCNA